MKFVAQKTGQQIGNKKAVKPNTSNLICIDFQALAPISYSKDNTCR